MGRGGGGIPELVLNYSYIWIIVKALDFLLHLP